MKKAAPEEDIGFEIFTDTTEDYRERLAGSDTEQVYLTSGTYHRLADMIRIGWHPRFKQLMTKFIVAP
jgi:ABC-3C protein